MVKTLVADPQKSQPRTTTIISHPFGLKNCWAFIGVVRLELRNRNGPPYPPPGLVMNGLANPHSGTIEHDYSQYKTTFASRTQNTLGPPILFGMWYMGQYGVWGMRTWTSITLMDVTYVRWAEGRQNNNTFYTTIKAEYGAHERNIKWQINKFK